MSPENFVYWLQGMLEIGSPKILDEGQVQIIKDHIALVLTKVTPDRPYTPPTSPWWGVQLPRSDGYMTCTSSTDLNLPASCGVPITEFTRMDGLFVESPFINYAIEGSC